jgi:hypothetical protein
MTITITIQTDNAAFAIDNGGPEQEVARILHKLAAELSDGLTNIPITGRKNLRDINGNTVGSVLIRE